MRRDIWVQVNLFVTRINDKTCVGPVDTSDHVFMHIAKGCFLMKNSKLPQSSDVAVEFVPGLHGWPKGIVAISGSRGNHRGVTAPAIWTGLLVGLLVFCHVFEVDDDSRVQLRRISW